LAEGARPGRNEPCHCGSGKKYKQCHLDKDEAADRAARAKAAEAAASPAEAASEGDAKPGAATARPSTRQPWKKGATNTRGFQRASGTRKVGGGG
jgi:hypothetical protein